MEDIFIPALGMAMEEASLVEWLKQPGDPVAPGDEVAVIETDKATMELTANSAGVLGAHRFQAGDAIGVGKTVTVVLAPGEVEGQDEQAPSPTASSPNGDGSPATGGAPSTGSPGSAGTDGSTGDGAPGAAADTAHAPETPQARLPHRLSPRQRRLAAEQAATAAAAPAAAAGTAVTGIPVAAPSDRRLSPPERFAAAHGTRPVAGRATEGAAGANQPADAAAASTRAAIARAVSQSWSEIPHFAVSRDVAADGLTDRLANEPRSDSVAVSVTDVLIRALGRALAVRGTSDIGLAVATPAGVVIPVLPSVADRTLAEIAQLRRSAVDRARRRVMTDDDRSTPLMTLSNLGTHGVSWFTGIIPLGQQGLLTVGTLAQQPIVRDGRLAVGWRLAAILNVDHRAWDGADAAALLSSFAAQVQAYGRYADD